MKQENRYRTQINRSEEKVVGFSSASLFHARKQEKVTQGGNHGDRPPDEEDNPGSRYYQRLGGKARYF